MDCGWWYLIHSRGARQWATLRCDAIRVSWNELVLTEAGPRYRGSYVGGDLRIREDRHARDFIVVGRKWKPSIGMCSLSMIESNDHFLSGSWALRLVG
jgi:hypothetical protein